MPLSRKVHFDRMAEMDIIFLGHSSFRIKGKTASLVTDPFDPVMVGFKFPQVEADIVTVSHDHADHNQVSLVQNVKKTVLGPGEYEIMGISIIGIPVFHDDKKGRERGKNTIYVYEIDGLRLCHLGDLGHTLSEETLDEIGDIDILLIPVGGEYTIGPKEAAEVVQLIEPSYVLPMHYKMEGINPEVFANLSGLPEFLKETGLVHETLPKLSVGKEDLQEGQNAKVIVLTKR